MKKQSANWLVIAFSAIALPLAAQAQFFSPTLTFDSAPLDDEVASQELFQTPQFSSTTNSYIILNDAGQYNQNSVFRASGLFTSSPAALRVIFRWNNPADPNAWLRLSTFNGPLEPNPTLNTQGQVRFNITNRSELFFGRVGIVLGIRETGTDARLMENGGTIGAIEWVGVDATPNGIMAGDDGIVDTVAAGDDVQVVSFGADLASLDLPAGTAVISPGNNGVLDTTPSGDDVVRAGFIINGNGDPMPVPAVYLDPSSASYAVEFDLSTGTISVDSGTPVGTVAGFTGNGILDPANDRGTLEHIAFINDPSDLAELIEVAIDDLEFESPVADPAEAPTVLGPVFTGDTSVTVSDLDPTVNRVQLFRDGALAGTITAGLPASEVSFTLSPAAITGEVLTATQRIPTTDPNGSVSAASNAVVVFEPGTALAESFDSYADQDDLEAVWIKTDPTNDRAIELADGGAASCDKYLSENIPAGSAASRLYYDLGSVNGTDAEPLLLTYWFRHTSNSSNARGRIELSPSTAANTPGAVGFGFSNDSGFTTVLREEYTPFIDVVDPNNYPGLETNYFGYSYGRSGIVREANVWHKMEVEVLSNVVNYYIDDALVNPLDPNDGSPLYPAGVPRPNTSNFQYLSVGVGFSSNGSEFQYDSISVTLGGAPIPFGAANATPSPSVESIIVPGTTSVEVMDIDPNVATAVTLYIDGVAQTPVVPTQSEMTLSTPFLSNGQVINATQTIAGVESCFSRSAVVAVPAPSITSNPRPGSGRIEVSGLYPGFTSQVRVYLDDGDLTLVGTVDNPISGSAVVAISPTPELGELLYATQVIDDVESPLSAAGDVTIMGQWIETSSIPVGSTGHRLAYSNGYVYCIGGRTSESTAATRAVNYVYYAKVNEDGSLGPWITTTSLPVPLASLGATAYNGRIYAWGGWTDTYATLNGCYYADPDPNGAITSWVQSSVTIPNLGGVTTMDSFGNGMLAWQNNLYIINGELNDGSLTNQLFYSTLDGTGDYGAWVQMGQTVSADNSWFHGTAVIEGTTENYFYRLNGNHGGTSENDSWVGTIDPNGTLKNWAPVTAEYPFGVYEFANTVVDNKWIFGVNGLNGSTPLDNCYFAPVNPDTGDIPEWYQGVDYPLAISRNAAISYKAGDRYYILVVSGGPYSSAGVRDSSCYYAEVGRYFDMKEMADYQTQGLTDLNNDEQIDGDDIAELERYFVGPTK